MPFLYPMKWPLESASVEVRYYAKICSANRLPTAASQLWSNHWKKILTSAQIIFKDYDQSAKQLFFRTPIGTREIIVWGFKAKTAWKGFLHKNKLMIRSAINILPLDFANFPMCLRNTKKYHYDFKNSHISVWNS